MTESTNRKTFDRYPMLWLAVCFAAGILIANSVSIDLKISLAISAVFAVIAFLLNKHSIATLFVAVSFVSAGVLVFQCELKRNTADDRLRVLFDNGVVGSGSPVEVEGVLLGRPEPSVDGEFLTLRAETLRYRGDERHVSGNVRLFVPVAADGSELPKSDLKYGSRIRIACILEREDEYLNPGVQPKREILDRLGIDATGSVKSRLLIEHIADESVFRPLAWVYDQRASLIDDFRKNLSRPAAGVMIASLLGDKYFLDKDTADLFREGGTFHILVISGLHITFIGGLLLLFLRQLTRNRWLQFAVTTSVLWAYTLAVGADVPVVRASIMFTVVLFAYAIYRRGTLLNSLGICSLILLTWRPSDLFNPSFQLTFVSVGAIVALAYPLVESLKNIGSWTPTPAAPFPPNVPDRLKRFCEMLYWRENVWTIEAKQQIWTARLLKSPYLAGRIGEGIQRVARYIFEGILVSLIVQICMLPLSVVYFHRVSVASVLLNIWVGFFIAIESFAAVIGALIGHFTGLLAAPFSLIADVSNWLMLSLPRQLSAVNWASFRLPAYTGAGRDIYFLYFVPLLILAIAVNSWRPFEIKAAGRFIDHRVFFAASSSALILVAIVVFHPFSASAPDGRLHIDFLDVGQGDSSLVTFPDGETLLVDGGGRFKYRDRTNTDDESEPFEPDTRGIGEAVVSEVLWWKGYSRIDHILATHADADHIQGLGDVARNFSIGSAMFGRMPMDNQEFGAVREVLRRRGIPAETIARGDVLKFGDVTVEVLYPMPTPDPNSVSDNNHSVVLRIVYGNRMFLLTGDIERQAEAELLASGGTLNADLIKVPHHGSHTSSTQGFIDAVAPQYAVISVGRRSPFGHPHKEIVERWKTAGVNVMTTGERGLISVSTDGKDLLIKTFVE